VERLLSQFGLEEFADAKPDTLSGGYRRRLMIARAMVHSPEVLFLDEPTTGLDPQARMAVWDIISALKQEGIGIILTTHYMDEAERLSDSLAVMKEGRVVATGSSEDVLEPLFSCWRSGWDWVGTSRNSPGRKPRSGIWPISHRACWPTPPL
jgi:lipooligosaccharide transport system ATP-binding protein